MGDTELSVKERAVLLALMAEPGELTNRELEERVGFRLDGKERRTLNDKELVTSRRPGAAYVHSLSETGKEWCRQRLSVSHPSDSGSMERALFALLRGIKRYLDRPDGAKARTLDDLLRFEVAASDVEGRIRAAYDDANAGGPGSFVRLAELRTGLADLSRHLVDAALESMYERRVVNLVPVSDSGKLTDVDRAASLNVGEEDKHRIAFPRS